MADHVRTQIRNGFVTLLTGLATTGARVYKARVYPLESADPSGLLVFTHSERVSVESLGAPRLYDRSVRVAVVAIAKATDSVAVDDQLDQICKEVEVALAMPSTLDSIAKSITLVSTQFEIRGGAEVPTGAATMVYDVAYITQETAPDVAL